MGGALHGHLVGVHDEGAALALHLLQALELGVVALVSRAQGVGQAGVRALVQGGKQELPLRHLALAVALRTGEHGEDAFISGVKGALQRKPRAHAQAAVGKRAPLHLREGHHERDGAARAHAHHEVLQAVRVLPAPHHRLAVVDVEGLDGKGGRALVEAPVVVRERLARQAGLLVDPVGGEHALAREEGLPVAEAGVAGDVGEALARTPGVAVQVVHHVGRACRHAAGEGEADALLDERDDGAGGIARTHSAALEQQRAVLHVARLRRVEGSGAVGLPQPEHVALRAQQVHGARLSPRLTAHQACSCVPAALLGSGILIMKTRPTKSSTAMESTPSEALPVICVITATRRDPMTLAYLPNTSKKP